MADVSRAGYRSQSEWMLALRTLNLYVPGALEVFDRLCESAPVGYDALECSFKVSGGLDRHRATRYFDTGRYPAKKVAAVDDLFRCIAARLKIDVASLDDTLLRSVERHDMPLQTVLGVDAGGPDGLRLKYYWVLKAHSRALMVQLLGQLGVDAPRDVDLDKVYICGLDFNSVGLQDLKLYFALDRSRLGRSVKNLAPVRDLLADCKLVCFQHCLMREGKRQLFFHARHSSTVQRTLEKLGKEEAPARELLEHVGCVNSVLSGARLTPWIIAFPYVAGCLDFSAFNVYFHPDESG